MHLIDALAAGIRGAESGTFAIYKRGTATLATYYTDFEGVSSGATTNPKPSLDSNGAAVVYVNELVEVRAYNSAGTLVRTFTSGHNATAIEVKSQSFTGTNYETGASAANEPTTLQAVLDKWKTSSGTTDFNVLSGTTVLTLGALASQLALPFFNVQAPAYGAVGDGTTDDTAAVQAAISAASAAGGGVVIFPAGNYFITDVLTISAGVELYGAARELSKITFDSSELASATYAFLYLTGTGTVRIGGLSILMDATSSVDMWQVGTHTGSDALNLVISACQIGDATNYPDTDTMDLDTTGKLTVLNSTVHAGAKFANAEFGDGGDFEIVDTEIFFHGSTQARVIDLGASSAASNALVLGCQFDFTDATTTSCIIDSPSGTGEYEIASCRFEVASHDLDMVVGSGGSYKLSVSGSQLPTDQSVVVTSTASFTGSIRDGGCLFDVSVSDNAAAYTIPPGARNVFYEKTGTTAITATLPSAGVCWEGRELRFVLYSTAGSVTLNLSGGQFVDASPVVGVNDYEAFHFVFMGGVWIETGTSAGAT